MSECSLVLEQRLHQMMAHDEIIERLVEENRLKQLAIEKASGLVQSFTEEISTLRSELQLAWQREHHLQQELTLYKEELHPKLTNQLKQKERVISELHHIIRIQEKERMDILFKAGTKHKRQQSCAATEGNFYKQRMLTEQSANNDLPRKKHRITAESNLSEKTVEKVKQSLLWLREIVRSNEYDSDDTGGSRVKADQINTLETNGTQSISKRYNPSRPIAHHHVSHCEKNFNKPDTNPKSNNTTHYSQIRSFSRSGRN